MQVPYVNLPAQYAEEKDEIQAAIQAVFEKGDFIGGRAVGKLEEDFAAFCGVKEVIAVNSGTDALILSMKVLDIGPGDEVITPPNSFVASTAAIVHVGATPIFADVLPDQNIDPEAVEAAVTPRTKAIMPVHLTGRMADMDRIQVIAKKHGLAVIEDAAQSVGSMLSGRMSGAIGDLGCFSAHPLKNLNAAGDAGLITTNDAAMAARLRRLINHGQEDRDTVVEWGYVSRMDTLQAGVLSVRLRNLPSVIERRRRNAALYQDLLDPTCVFFPPDRNTEFNTFHTFVVQVDQRDELQRHLADQGIGSAIHYPIPIHLQPAAKDLGYETGSMPQTERQAGRILTLPVNQFLTEEQVRQAAETVNAFCAKA
jgi:dTDP-4-amino-4,6-dideoxygalactose transaminase